MALEIYLAKYNRPAKEVKLAEEAHAEQCLKIETSIAKKIGVETVGIPEPLKADKYWSLVRKAFSDAGLGEDALFPKEYETIEINSEKYPEHCFKIGYFQSHNLENGFNKFIAPRCNGCDLSYVFKIETNDYTVAVDWTASLERAKSLKNKLIASAEKYGNKKISYISHRDLTDEMPGDLTDEMPGSKEEAIDKFLQQTYGNIFNSLGEFYSEPQKVVAILRGSAIHKGRNIPCLYIVKECEPGENVKELEWYMQAIDIIIETCEYVLKQDNPDNYMLHWSV